MSGLHRECDHCGESFNWKQEWWKIPGKPPPSYTEAQGTMRGWYDDDDRFVQEPLKWRRAGKKNRKREVPFVQAAPAADQGLDRGAQGSTDTGHDQNDETVVVDSDEDWTN